MGKSKFCILLFNTLVQRSNHHCISESSHCITNINKYVMMMNILRQILIEETYYTEIHETVSMLLLSVIIT